MIPRYQNEIFKFFYTADEKLEKRFINSKEPPKPLNSIIFSFLFVTLLIPKHPQYVLSISDHIYR